MSANSKPLNSEDAIVACLNILAALTASPTGSVNTATIEREFDLTDQQLEEAVDLLQSLADERTGARVAVELEEGRITLLGTAGRISPLRLTPAESLALGQALARCNLDPEVRKRIQDALGPAGKADDPKLLAGDALLGGFFPVIAEALSIGARLRMRYRSVLESSPSERIVDPGYIEVVGDAAYLVAWDVSKNLQRSYRLDRIDGCELTDDSVVAHHLTPLTSSPGTSRKTCNAATDSTASTAASSPMTPWSPTTSRASPPPTALGNMVKALFSFGRTSSYSIRAPGQASTAKAHECWMTEGSRRR